ncbi:MBL fold metallo-hydrolase [Fibrobacter sp. UWH4]|uniref:MBL fold metallo-hydrolase n=1 Tax=Fibrobacter sp. UWH4 TaxID=1896210 RepID=UPI000920D757|nr:MBL fold metallo-hydrolase [Fibrobacter sp. UWH4]SHL55228.1 7,8-dihydropterin-6-yl-methyl-4-(beta-D-ribofuranosyl)aminobenzene 5'-phosphate synthase [Fibrobacter sp. UWH4]
MKVQVLIDNVAGTSGSRKLFGEWGLSVYVEFEGVRYLLDTGASHLFAKNAGVMGVDLSKVDIGILSHAHFDHSDGMAKFFALNRTAPFYLRKGAGENCYHAHKLIGRFTYHEYIGIHKGFLKRFADRIRFGEGDMQIAPNVYLVPHKTPGLSSIGERAHLSVKENGKYRYDSFDHEQSLVFDTPQGLFVMNSCSHGGADNIVKEIEATFPGKKIYALLGGFHLFRYKDEVVRAFAARLRELDVQKIYTGHCTGNRAFEILREVLGDRAEQMYTGMTVEI